MTSTASITTGKREMPYVMTWSQLYERLIINESYVELACRGENARPLNPTESVRH